MKKSRVFAGICIGIIAFGLITYSCVMESVLKEIFIVLISLIAAVAALLQMNKNTALTTGGFILNLQEVYNNTEDFLKIFLECWADYNLEDYPYVLETKRTAVINYLTFFESIYIMMNEGCLNIGLLDELFGRRFFIVVNNRRIQDMELIANDKYYTNVYKLYDVWKEYRIKQEKCKKKQFPGYRDELIHVANDNYMDLQKRRLQIAQNNL